MAMDNQIKRETDFLENYISQNLQSNSQKRKALLFSILSLNEEIKKTLGINNEEQ